MNEKYMYNNGEVLGLLKAVVLASDWALAAALVARPTQPVG